MRQGVRGTAGLRTRTINHVAMHRGYNNRFVNLVNCASPNSAPTSMALRQVGRFENRQHMNKVATKRHAAPESGVTSAAYASAVGQKDQSAAARQADFQPNNSFAQSATTKPVSTENSTFIERAIAR